jgi:hypothetical protein
VDQELTRGTPPILASTTKSQKEEPTGVDIAKTESCFKITETENCFRACHAKTESCFRPQGRQNGNLFWVVPKQKAVSKSLKQKTVSVPAMPKWKTVSDRKGAEMETCFG